MPMHEILIDDEALRLLLLAKDDAGLGTFSEVIRYLYRPRPKKTEPDPEKERIVVAEPLFGKGHQHSAWGADCPVCKNYFFEDCDTMPLPIEERPSRCDSCEQKIRLIYPWELEAGMRIG
jgi:hypothetical protein